MAGRPRLPSPRPSDEEEEDDEDDEDGDMAEDAEGMIEADVPREESPVYQSIERQSRAPLPHKKVVLRFCCWKMFFLFAFVKRDSDYHCQ